MKKNTSLLLAVIAIIAASGLIFFWYKSHRQPRSESVAVESVTPSSSPLATPASGVTSLKVPALGHENVPEMVVSTDNDGSDLDTALTKKYGTHATFSIDSTENGYAQGVLKIPGKQDKWWLAVQKNGEWKIIADGYAYVNCRDIATYNFPTSMVPVCWGKNTLITR